MQALARSVTRLAFVAFPLLLSACGESDDGGGGADPASFVGTWAYTSGSLNAECTGFPAQMLDLTGTLTVTAGTSTDLILTDQYCTVTLDVSGNTASASATARGRRGR